MLPEEEFGVDKEGLVPQELGTFAGLLLEAEPGLLFEDVAVALGD